MASLDEIKWFQLTMLVIAVLARCSYYLVIQLIPKLKNKETSSAWSEFTRIGSDLCLMSFATMFTALFNQASNFSSLIASDPGYKFRIPIIFLGFYILAYFVHKLTALRNPFVIFNVKSVANMGFVLLSWWVGYYALLAACGLAIIIQK